MGSKFMNSVEKKRGKDPWPWRGEKNQQRGPWIVPLSYPGFSPAQPGSPAAHAPGLGPPFVTKGSLSISVFSRSLTSFFPKAQKFPCVGHRSGEMRNNSEVAIGVSVF